MLAQKSFEKAISDFSKSIELKSDYAEAYYGRGISFINSGKKEMGCQDLQSASRLGLANANEAIQSFCR